MFTGEDVYHGGVTHGEDGRAMTADEPPILRWAGAHGTAEVLEVLASHLDPRAPAWVLWRRRGGSWLRAAAGRTASAGPSAAPAVVDALDLSASTGRAVSAGARRIVAVAPGPDVARFERPVSDRRERERFQADRPAWGLELAANAIDEARQIVLAHHLAVALDRCERFEELERLSTVDPATGLFNSRHLESVLRREVSRCERFGGSLCLLFLDLDRFKSVNDQLGHTAGTGFLANIGRVLLEGIRQTDYAFRYGGDEFAVLLVEATKTSGSRVADRLRQAISSHAQRYGDARREVTVSVGVATFPTDATSVDALLSRADAAMYAAKDRGRNAVYTLDLGPRQHGNGFSGDLSADTTTLSMDVDRPILLWDIMGTLVTEPFVEAVPRHFGVSLEQLIQQKDPQAWIRFERGEIDEDEYCATFFRDRRPVDKRALKDAMSAAYDFLPGVEALLQSLHANGVPMYALSNYSPWYALIEHELRLSRWLAWDFVSCHTGFRKPEPEAYASVLEALGVPAERCIFVDDRVKNVEGARRMGMQAILRPDDPEALGAELLRSGIPVDST